MCLEQPLLKYHIYCLALRLTWKIDYGEGVGTKLNFDPLVFGSFVVSLGTHLNSPLGTPQFFM